MEVWHSSSENFLFGGVHKSWQIASSVWSLLVLSRLRCKYQLPSAGACSSLCLSHCWGKENHSLFKAKKTPGSRYTAVAIWVWKKSRVWVFSGYHGVWIDCLLTEAENTSSLCLLVSDGEILSRCFRNCAFHCVVAFPVHSCHGKKLVSAGNKDAM